ncbi:MAG: butyrate kinase [Planctomycetota bacterium]
MKDIIIAINPGSTSTKFAAYKMRTELFCTTIKHSNEELAKYPRIIDQYKFRADLIAEGIERAKISDDSIAAVVGRGGLLYPLKEGGTYEVNDEMVEDLRNAVQGEHASNLGALIAREIAAKAGCPAYIVDPVIVDEKMDVTRLSGFPGIPRKSIFHALNQRAVAKRFASSVGKEYPELNLIVAHLGGGISVGAHRKGRVVDVNNALDGDGPFSPERSGTVPAGDLVRLCFSGDFTKEEVLKMIKGNGGVVGYLGTNDMMAVEHRYLEGEEFPVLVMDSMAYQVASQICSLFAAYEGEHVDAVLLTGGLARCKPLVDKITWYLGSIRTEIQVYPGEDEMGALRDGAMFVLLGKEPVKTYKRPEGVGK